MAKKYIVPSKSDDVTAQARVDQASEEAVQLAFDALYNRSLERALHDRMRRKNGKAETQD